jgi:hypothetical protein
MKIGVILQTIWKKQYMNNNENTNYNQNTDKVVGFKPNLRANSINRFYWILII